MPCYVVRKIRRHPVKAMAGESLAEVEVDARGLVGDRWYAVVDGDGKLASGKHSHRFRRRDPVFGFAARTTDGGVRVSGAEGEWTVGEPDLDTALTRAMGASVRVLAENATPHFDDAAVSLVGTASLDWCREHLEVDADPLRLRANLVVDTDEPFVEETWHGDLLVGDVRLAPVGRTERCRMIDIAQQGLGRQEGRWLRGLSGSREMKLGIYLEVRATGVIRTGDAVRPV